MLGSGGETSSSASLSTAGTSTSSAACAACWRIRRGPSGAPEWRRQRADPRLRRRQPGLTLARVRSEAGRHRCERARPACTCVAPTTSVSRRTSMARSRWPPRRCRRLELRLRGRRRVARRPARRRVRGQPSRDRDHAHQSRQHRVGPASFQAGPAARRQEWSFDDAAAVIRERSLRIRPSLPTAVGHCMFVRRSALDLVGDFDPAFSPGYGEEVDFSQRCLRAGLSHVLADDVLVLHHGGGSFGRNGKPNPVQESTSGCIKEPLPLLPRADPRGRGRRHGAARARVGRGP